MIERNKVIFEQILLNTGANFAYLIGCPDTRKAALVDPAYETGRLLARVKQRDLKLEFILNTHGHSDHIGGNEALRRATGAEVVAHSLARHSVDKRLEHQDTFQIGQIKVKVLHTPGHTPDGVCFIVDERMLLTGDTLFVGECGRTDLPGSDPRQLWHSFFEVLYPLPDELVIYPGHDYGPKPFSALGEEKATNYTLEKRDIEEFVRFMAEP